MDIKSLMECEYVSEVKEIGTAVEFKTFLYSSELMSMKQVTITCPVSGDYILTECAEILGEEVKDDTQKILTDLFVTLQESSKIDKKIKSNDVVYNPLDLKLRDASSIFIKENIGASSLDTNEDIEDAKFKFLAICSRNFTKVYERTKNKQQSGTKRD